MVSLEVEVAHTDLSKVTGVVFIDVGAVVVLQGKSNRESAIPSLSTQMCWISIEILFPYLTTGHTTTTGMLPVFSDATVTGTDVATVLASLAESGRHLDSRDAEGGGVRFGGCRRFTECVDCY